MKSDSISSQTEIESAKLIMPKGGSEPGRRGRYRSAPPTEPSVRV